MPTAATAHLSSSATVRYKGSCEVVSRACSVGPSRGAPWRIRLLRDACLDRFLHYVTFDTQSDENSDDVSFDGEAARAAEAPLCSELKEIGLEGRRDGRARLRVRDDSRDDARRRSVPVVGFIAHVDTSPEMPGVDVKPIVHKNYQGQDLVLPDDPKPVLKFKDNPLLADQIGCDIVTASGATLLGADNKAGVAEIVAARRVPDEAPGDSARRASGSASRPTKRSATAPKFFDVEKFGAACAYTMDGETKGEIEMETWSADAITISFQGNNTHPGYAKGR